MKRILLAIAVAVALAIVARVDAQTINRALALNSGEIIRFTGTDPGAGVEVSETVPATYYWRVLSFRVAFVTSATVANRFPALTLDDGTTVFGTFGVGAAITASQTAAITWADTSGIIAPAVGLHLAALPSSIILPPGYRVRTATTAIDAGDNYGAPSYLVERWRFK
jgi:hypothetical protein